MTSTTTHSACQVRPISFRKRALFSAIVFVATYLFLEAVSYLSLRWVDGRWYTWVSASEDRTQAVVMKDNQAPLPTFIPSMAGIVHPYLGYVMPPNWEPEMPVEWASPKDFTNRPCDGFSSLVPVVQKRSANTVIIGIFGGSVAEIFYFQGTPFLIKHLREHPQFRDKEFVVVNLASGGYKQPQQLMALNYLLAQGGELDLLINLDGFNEVALHPAENQKSGVYPIYPRAWSARVGQIRDHQILKLYGRAAIAEEQFRDAVDFFSRAPMSYSPACHLIWRGWRPILEKRIRSAKAAVENSAADDSSIRTGEGYRPACEQAMYEDLVQLWETCSRLMRTQCTENGIRYYHFLQPNQYVEGSKQFSPAELKHALLDDHPYRDGVKAGYPRLRQAGERLAESGENFTDLTDAFATRSEQIYFDTCCHFGSLGNQIVANRIAQAILMDACGK